MISHEQAQELLEDATAGPWRWRNTTREVYLMGDRSYVVMAFGRMGMQGAQPQFRDKHNLLVDAGLENIYDYSDARLIAAAPELAATVIALYERLGHAQAGSEESGIPAHVKQVLTGQEP